PFERGLLTGRVAEREETRGGEAGDLEPRLAQTRDGAGHPVLLELLDRDPDRGSAGGGKGLDVSLERPLACRHLAQRERGDHGSPIAAGVLTGKPGAVRANRLLCPRPRQARRGRPQAGAWGASRSRQSVSA